MNCWVCNHAGITKAALAACAVCGVGLCRDHRLEQARGSAGTRIECRHFNTETAPRKEY
jgi:hypothetical protein